MLQIINNPFTEKHASEHKEGIFNSKTNFLQATSVKNRVTELRGKVDMPNPGTKRSRNG